MSQYTYPTVTIQQMLFTAKRWGQFPTITYQNGGTAGSESVSVDSSFNITVVIQSGTSTNTQIAAAIAASTSANHLGAGDLVLAAPVSGHESDTPTCTTAVPLAGGVTAAVKASRTLAGITFTADAAGTAGNSIRIKLTAGAVAGSEVVTVSTNDITIQVADAGQAFTYTPFSYPVAGTNYSTIAQVMAAINASGAAAALVDVSTALGANRGVYVGGLGAFTALTGGLAAAPAAVVVNGLTITSNTNDATQNGKTITLKPGATAGSEVVTVSSGNVSCTIESGVSTITQVRTALNAAGAFSALYTATGTSATALNAVYQNATSGAASSAQYGWFSDNNSTPLTASFVYFPFGSMAEDFVAYNDETSGNKNVVGSWDGVNNAFILAPTNNMNLLSANRPGVYLKYTNGAPAYRAWTVNR